MVVKQPLVLRQNNNKATYLETTLQELSEDLLQKRLKTSSASCCTIMLLLFRRGKKARHYRACLLSCSISLMLLLMYQKNFSFEYVLKI